MRVVHLGLADEKKTFIQRMTWNNTLSAKSFAILENDQFHLEGEKHTGEDPESQFRPQVCVTPQVQDPFDFFFFVLFCIM